MSAILSHILGTLAALTLTIYATIRGTFYAAPSPRFAALLARKRNDLWDLSRPLPLTATEHANHDFVQLSGTTLHYLSSRDPALPAQSTSTGGGPEAPRNLLVFLHGFPDSAAVWLKLWTTLLTTYPDLSQNSTLIAPDLPGFGGSGNLSGYDATAVLECVVDFIEAMRERYLPRSSSGLEGKESKVILVSHDWGAGITGRLSVECPAIADHFILINGPIIAFAQHNIAARVQSGLQQLKSMNFAAAREHLAPVLAQLSKSYYIFVFRLPGVLGATVIPMAFWAGKRYFSRCLGTLAVTGRAEMRVHDDKGKQEEQEEKVAEHLAGMLGPGDEALRSTVPDSVAAANGGVNGYWREVGQRVRSRGGWGNVETESLRYYREGLGSGEWRMSERTRGMCEEMEKGGGKLKRPVTIVWGMKDVALDARVMVQGVEEWSEGKARVRYIEKVGHWAVSQEGTAGVDITAEEILKALKASP